MAHVWGPPPIDPGPRPRRLLLARHGATEWNSRRIWQGHADVPLNDLGRAQAAALAARLTRDGADALWSSDLSRARETAEAVGAALGREPVVTPLLREIDIGRWEGLDGDTIAAREPDVMAALARGEDVPRGGGETLAGFQARVVRGFEEAAAAAAGGTLVLVVHGGVVKVLVAHLLGLPRERSGRLTSGGNAGLSEVVFGPAGPQLVRLNDTAHLAGLDGAAAVDSA